MRYYKGYTLEKTGDEWFPYRATVNGKVEYHAVSLGQAKRWVDGYRDGVTWAVQEKLAQDFARKCKAGA
jgi:hypothetical protein